MKKYFLLSLLLLGCDDNQKPTKEQLYMSSCEADFKTYICMEKWRQIGNTPCGNPGKQNGIGLGEAVGAGAAAGATSAVVKHLLK